MGKLRAGYILPWAGADILDSGVFWPMGTDPMAVIATTASHHHLIWVDLGF